MNELDKVIEIFLENKKQVISKNAAPEDMEELVEALREKTKDKIVSEVRAEYKKELRKEISIELQEEQHNKKINELKTLMWEGFIIAFVVGLTTDQVTDIISYYKGASDLVSVWPTLVLAVIFLLIAVGFYVYTFFNNVLSIIREYKEVKKK